MSIEVEETVQLKEPLVREVLRVLYPNGTLEKEYGDLTLRNFFQLFEDGRMASQFEAMGKQTQMATWACLVFDAASDSDWKIISNLPKSERSTFLSTMRGLFPYKYNMFGEVRSQLTFHGINISLAQTIRERKIGWLLYGYGLNDGRRNEDNRAVSKAKFSEALPGIVSTRDVQPGLLSPLPDKQTIHEKNTAGTKRLNLRRLPFAATRKHDAPLERNENSRIKNFQKSAQAYRVAKKKREEAYSVLSTAEAIKVRGARNFRFAALSLFFVLIWVVKQLSGLHGYFVSSALAQEASKSPTLDGSKSPFVPPLGIPHDVWTGMVLTMFAVVLVMTVAFFYKGYFAKDKSEIAASWSERFLSAILGMIVGKAI